MNRYAEFYGRAYEYSTYAIILTTYLLLDYWVVNNYDGLHRILSVVEIIYSDQTDFKYYINLGIYSLICIILIWKNPLKNLYLNNKLYGNVKWATKNEIKKMKFFAEKNESITIGKCKSFIGNFIGNPYIRTKEPLSMLLIEPSGSGKTSGTIIPTLITNKKNSMIILDLKGEIAHLTRGHKNKHAKTIIFNPKSEFSNKWNPFSKENLNPNDQLGSIERISEIVFEGGEQDKDKFFSDNANRFLTNVALALTNIKGETSFKEIKRVITPTSEEGTNTTDNLKIMCNQLEIIKRNLENETKDLYKLQKKESNKKKKFKLNTQIENAELKMNQIEENNSALNNFIEASKSEKSFEDIKSTFLANTKIFNNERVNLNTSKSDFTFAELRKNKKPLIIYFVVQFQDIETLKMLIKIFFTSAANYLTSVNKLKKDKFSLLKFFKFNKNKNKITEDERDVMMILDEFPQLGKMKKITQLLSVARSYGLKLMLIAQSYPQIKEIYTREGFQSIVSNCSTIVFAKPKDTDTIKEITEKLGKTTTITQDNNNPKQNKYFGTDGSRKIAYDFMPKELIEKMKTDEIIIINQNQITRPVFAKQGFYYKDRTLSNLVKKSIKETPYDTTNSDDISDPRENLIIDEKISKENKITEQLLDPENDGKDDNPYIEELEIPSDTKENATETAEIKEASITKTITIKEAPTKENATETAEIKEAPITKTATIKETPTIEKKQTTQTKKSSKMLIKIFFTSAANYLTSVNKLKKDKFSLLKFFKFNKNKNKITEDERDVMMILDEFPQLGKMKKITQLDPENDGKDDNPYIEELEIPSDTKENATETAEIKEAPTKENATETATIKEALTIEKKQTTQTKKSSTGIKEFEKKLLSSYLENENKILKNWAYLEWYMNLQLMLSNQNKNESHTKISQIPDEEEQELIFLVMLKNKEFKRTINILSNNF